MPEDFQPGGRAPAPHPLRLVQDFVNTEIPEWHRDDIGSPDALGAWLRDRGLAAAGDQVDGELFVAARALRSALRELALANTLGTRPEPGRSKVVDAALRRFPLAVRLVEGVPTLAPAATGAAAGLAAIVAVVAEAQASGSWPRLKACRHETCGWIFYDGSRNRSSSWCSMQVCGGRAKARSYRSRHAGRSSAR